MDGLPGRAPFLSGIDIGLWFRLTLALIAMVGLGVALA